QERPVLGVQGVELQEVVGEAVVEDRVLGVQPLAVEDGTLSQRGTQGAGVRPGPALEEVEVLLAGAAGQEVTPALQPELPRRVEGTAGVGPVQLLLDNERATGQGRKGDALAALIAGLEPGALQVVRARVLV